LGFSFRVYIFLEARPTFFAAADIRVRASGFQLQFLVHIVDGLARELLSPERTISFIGIPTLRAREVLGAHRASSRISVPAERTSAQAVRDAAGSVRRVKIEFAFLWRETWRSPSFG